MPRRSTGRPRGRPPYPDLLTPAEERVLEQVRLGLGDTEIANVLGVSRETVKYHVGNLFSKTYVSSRAELAAWRPEEEVTTVPARRGIFGWPVRVLSAHPRVAMTAGFVTVAVTLAAFAFLRARPPDEAVTQAPIPGTPSSPPPSATATAPSATPVQGVITAAITPIPAGPPSPAYVEFLDAQTGYLFARPEVYVTRDGGLTWEETGQVPGIPYDASFVSMDQGWVTTHEGLYATEDGGRTWKRRYRPEESLTQIEFVDAARGFASDLQGVYFQTTNGGRTWADVGGPCRDGWHNVFDFSSPQQGFLLCSEVTSGDYSEKWLYSTEDGGVTWTPLSIADLACCGYPEAPDVPKTFPPVYRAQRMSTPDGRTIVVAGDGGLFRSDDGGLTWRTLLEAGISESYASALTMVSPAEGFILTSYGGPMTLFSTTDGGETWTSPGRGDTPAGYYDFVNDATGYGIGMPVRPGAVVRTDDAGASWVVVGETMPPDAMDFADADHGWTVAIEGNEYVVQSSADGGASWMEASRIHAESPGYAVDVSFIDPSTGYLADTEGRLWRTDDGGRTFAEVQTDGSLRGSQLSGYGFRFVDGDTGYVLAGRGLLTTIDGGRTWRAPASIDLESMDFIDPEHGWGSGPDDDGFVTTADGGTTWARYRMRQVRPQWVLAIDPTHAAFIDEQGCLYRTADGGATWIGVRCLRGR